MHGACGSQTVCFQPHSWCIALGAQNVATSIKQLIGKQKNGVLHALGSAGRLYRVSHLAKRAREQQTHHAFCPLLHCIKRSTGMACPPLLLMRRSCQTAAYCSISLCLGQIITRGPNSRARHW